MTNRISAITVRGFKSICTEQRVEVKPLTVLAGANSSGKSSLMQPLLLLKQTLEAPADPGALLLDGPNVSFTSAEQLLSRSSGKACAKDFSTQLELLDGESLKLLFRREEGKGFELEQMTYVSGEKNEPTTTVSADMTHEDILKIMPDFLRSVYADVSKKDSGARWKVYRERCFFQFELLRKGRRPLRVGLGLSAISPAAAFVPYIQGLIHLPALRGNPRRTYAKTAGGPDFQGKFDPYVASVISQWQAESSGKLRRLGETLEEMGLTWKVKAGRIADTQVELKVGRLTHGKQGGAQDLVNIADVGFGVSQALPVVVALLAARPGQLVYLEQPEIHLHPVAQRRLANVLQDAVQRDVVTVVETHSALLLREIQTLIATGKLSKDVVKLHWVKRGEDGSTTVTPADLDENGAYGNWPEDFDQTELEAEKEYLDAVERRGNQK